MDLTKVIFSILFVISVDTELVLFVKSESVIPEVPKSRIAVFIRYPLVVYFTTFPLIIKRLLL